VLIVHHDHASPAGPVADRFAARGWAVADHLVVPAESFHAPGVTTAFPDFTGFGAVVVLGSPWSAYDHALIGSWVLPEIEQLRWGWLDQVHLEDRERVRESWRAAVKSGAPFTSELRIRNAGGAYRWFRTHAVPLRDAAGAITKWYAMSTDIDDLKAASPSVGAHPER